MDKILKFKRGNTAKNNAYTGSAGELTVDTTKKTVVVHDGLTNGGSVLATELIVSNHTSRVDNPHNVTKSQVGLGNVQNIDSTIASNISQDSTHRFVTDSDKTNWNGKINATEKAVANGVATLDVNGKVVLTQIPDSIVGQLQYMGVHNFSSSLPTATEKGQYWIASSDGNGYITGDWAVWNGTSFDKVDNTDAVSTVAGRTGNVVLTKSDVGLANIDNTSDVNKPVSTAQQTALNLKANIASPALTGTPTAPTAAVGTSTTQVATTAFVNAEIANDAVPRVTSTDNALTRFNGTTGEIQNSNVIVDDIANIGLGAVPNQNTTLPTIFGNYLMATGYIENYALANCSYQSGFRYLTTGLGATQLAQISGNFHFITAPIGTAGDVVDFTERLKITSGGNIGVGTANPVFKLDVAGGSGNCIRYSDGNIGNIVGVSATKGQIGTITNHDLELLVGSTAKATITTNGNLLVGTTTDNGVDKLQVNGSISSGAIAIFTSGDLNDFKYKTQTIGTYPSGYMSNTPINDHGYLEIIVYQPNNYVMQRFTTLGELQTAGRTFVRTLIAGTWAAWVEK